MISCLDPVQMRELYGDLAARADAAGKGRVPGRTQCPLRHRPRAIVLPGWARARRSESYQTRHPRFRARDQP